MDTARYLYELYTRDENPNASNYADWANRRCEYKIVEIKSQKITNRRSEDFMTVQKEIIMQKVDIVKRLRYHKNKYYTDHVNKETDGWLLVEEAAQEIERLRSILDQQNIVHDEPSAKMKVVFDLIDEERLTEAKEQLLALQPDPEIRYPEVILSRIINKISGGLNEIYRNI